MKDIINDTVFINENNQIELIFEGYLVIDVLIPMLNLTDKYLQQVSEQNKPLQLLVDVSQLHKLSMESRRYGSDWIKGRKNLVIAVYGNNLFMKYFVNMLILATKKSGSMKFFSTKNEARLWLSTLK